MSLLFVIAGALFFVSDMAKEGRIGLIAAGGIGLMIAGLVIRFKDRRRS